MDPLGIRTFSKPIATARENPKVVALMREQLQIADSLGWSVKSLRRGEQLPALSIEGQAMSNRLRPCNRESVFPVHRSDRSLFQFVAYMEFSSPKQFQTKTYPELLRLKVQSSLYFSLLEGNLAERSSHQTASSAIQSLSYLL